MPGLEEPSGSVLLEDEDYLRAFSLSASELCAVPGGTSDEAVRQFLSTYPLPNIFRILEKASQGSALESGAVAALQRIFQSDYGAAMIPQVLPYSNMGLKAVSPAVRRLSCFAISQLLGSSGAASVDSMNDVDIELLLDTMADSESGVASAAADVLKKLALLPEGLDLIFEGNELAGMVSQGSPTVRMRVLELMAAMAENSEPAMRLVVRMGMAAALNREIALSEEDTLAAVNALELLGKLASSRNGLRFIAAAHVTPRLQTIISSPNTHSMVRAAAMTATAKLLRAEERQLANISDADAAMLMGALDDHVVRLMSAEDMDRRANEEETAAAMDAMAQLGTSRTGAELLLAGEQPPARHLTSAVFDSHTSSGVHLAAVHAVASMVGAEREAEGEGGLLSPDAEEKLRQLLYSSAAESITGPSLSSGVLSLLRQTEEMRIAMYRLIAAIVARPWALSELCSSPDIVTLVVDSRTESNRAAMEWRHSCCAAMASAARAAEARGGVSVPSDLLAQLDAASRRGPFLMEREAREAIPIVATAQRM